MNADSVLLVLGLGTERQNTGKENNEWDANSSTHARYGLDEWDRAELSKN